MDWFLRQWNERSFPGWRAWWMRVAAIALGYTLIEASVLSGRAGALPSLTSMVSLTLLLGAVWIALARLTAAVSVLSWRAALAGWSRALPLALFVPLIDGLLSWIAPTLVHGRWWVAMGAFPGWIAVGWAHGGFASLGAVALIITLAFGMTIRLSTLGVTRVRAIGMAALIVVGAWSAAAVPSFTAWGSVSTYGSTFAPVQRVIEQAFARTWEKTSWYAYPERFFDTRTTDGVSGRRLVLALFSWLALCGLAAPLMSRPDRRALREQAKEALVPAIPLMGGVIAGISRIPGQTVLGWVGWWLAVGFIAVLWSRYQRAQSMGDDDERWFVGALLLIGVWLFGWFSWLLLLGAIALQAVSDQATSWWERAGYAGGAAAVAFFLGWSMAIPGNGMVGSAGVILGVMGLWKALALASGAKAAGDNAIILGRTRLEGRSLDTALLAGWLVSVGLLWWGVGSVSFAAPALVLALLGPAALWVLPLTEGRQTRAVAILAFLLGLLLHPGIFVP